jgi:purine-nucleoside phosphorylase
MSSFDHFRAALAAVRPQAGVVFGSGLADAASPFTPTASIPFADVPGLVPPTVAGHKGRLAVGHWAGVPAVVSFGRVHFYEGHPWERVTRLVHHIAEFGVKALILTNAAGGIRSDLQPGDLMAIRGHLKWLDSGGWVRVADSRRESESDPLSARAGHPNLHPYSLFAASLPSGIYAALTGPCYETPAEIRALRVLGADAVGMSTAVEAETAAALGLTVAGISCITNKAAGLSDGPLSHREVEETAKLAVAKLAEVITGLLTSAVH